MYDKPPTERYKKLAEIANLENRSILDIGSGLGGFYEFLISNCKLENIDYQGIDIVPELILESQIKFPEAKFKCLNLLNEDLEKKYDYIFLCGIFNNHLLNGDDYMKEILLKAFEYCNEGIAFNFISAYVNYREENMEYHSPAMILDYCIKNLSKKVILHHHYMKCDTAVYVYR